MSQEKNNTMNGDTDKNRLRHQSTESGTSADSVGHYIPTPPDGGWGWVIVAASLVCNIIVDGIGYSFGIFLIEFVEYFGETKSATSLVGSLLCGTYLCAGPIVSALINKYGCRPVAVTGSIFASVAFLLSTLSNNITILCLTYGVLGGFGFGLIYLPSIVSVGYYFEKKRALATGIAVCGSGVGTFIFAPLATYLLEEYDWRNALYIIAGIILNGAVCGMLMRPLDPPPKKSRRKRARTKNVLDRISSKVRNRSESECSMHLYSVQHTNAILEGVRDAKMIRQNQLQEDDSELGSLPSSIFIKGLARQDSHAGKQSLSDKGDYDTPSYYGSPEGTLPRSKVDGTNNEHELTPLVTSTTDEHTEDVKSRSNSKKSRREVSPLSDSNDTTSQHGSVANGDVVDCGLRRHSSNKSRDRVQLDRQLADRQIADAKILAAALEAAPLLKDRPNGTCALGHSAKSHLNRPHLLHVGDYAPQREDYAKPMYKKDIFYSGN